MEVARDCCVCCESVGADVEEEVRAVDGVGDSAAELFGGFDDGDVDRRECCFCGGELCELDEECCRAEAATDDGDAVGELLVRCGAGWLVVRLLWFAAQATCSRMSGRGR